MEEQAKQDDQGIGVFSHQGMFSTAPALIGYSGVIQEQMEAFLVPGHNILDITLILKPLHQVLKKMKISRVIQIEEHPIGSVLLIHQGSCAQQTY